MDLGLSYYVDSNVIDEDTQALTGLRALDLAHRIRLTRSDWLDRELKTARDEKKRVRLLNASATITESISSVPLTAPEKEQYSAVFSALFPGTDPAKARRQKRFDALHISQAQKYGADGFITRDKELLKKGARMKATFNGFLVMTPEEALIICNRMAAKDAALKARLRKR